MKYFYLGLLASSFVVAGGLYCMASAYPEVIEAYRDKARTPLFSGFITLGSFLLTLKTTILQRLKEGFDSKEHEKAYHFHVANVGPCKYYQSLGNMSAALSLTVFLSLASAAAQMTLGFVEHPLAFSVCVAGPVTTLGSILYLWREITLAHKGWITKIEEDKGDSMRKVTSNEHAPMPIFDMPFGSHKAGRGPYILARLKSRRKAKG